LSHRQSSYALSSFTLFLVIASTVTSHHNADPGVVWVQQERKYGTDLGKYGTDLGRSSRILTLQQPLSSTSSISL
ncbi:hypothetical protein RRG08_020925, partial [Elysia crispata]